MNLKQKEYDMWLDWNSTNSPKTLGNLLTSFNPLIQGQVNKYKATNLPRSALETEARRLTVGAFKTYNPKKGAALNTHITNHLKHLQRYALKYQNVGAIPEHRGIMIGTYNSAKTRLEDKLGREPSTVELADELKISEAEIERMELELRKDLIINTNEEETFFDKDYNASDKIKNLIEMYYYGANNEERLVMEHSFGLGGKLRLNVADMAKKINIPEAQVRKIRSDIALKINEATRYEF